MCGIDEIGKLQQDILSIDGCHLLYHDRILSARSGQHTCCCVQGALLPEQHKDVQAIERKMDSAQVLSACSSA